jgi:lantibiotic modifying enzyme
VTAARELLQRVEVDRAELETLFNEGHPAGSVRRMEAELSDPHDGGRTVAVVTFDRGLGVVYKPRPVGLEAAFHALVEWWNRAAGDVDLRAARAAPHGNYGWAEFIEQAPCADEAAAGRYYERAGVLIGLAWLLDATDLHCGNLIAQGEYPVLVDLETLLHPRWPGERRSVLDTGLVPQWIRGPDGGLYDVSGLGAIATQWFAGEQVPMERNVVRTRGEITSPERFAERIVGGFRRAAAVVRSRREELLSADGPLQRFSGQPVRVILRHSLAYRSALTEPDSIATAPLLRPVREPEALEAINRAERQALLRGDIPRFTAATDSADWTPDPEITLRRYFAASSYDALIRRVRNGMKAVEAQARMLSTALALWRLRDLVVPLDDSAQRPGPEDMAPVV